MGSKLRRNDAENVKDYYNGARTSGLQAGSVTGRCTPIVTVGHLALDAALAGDPDRGPSLRSRQHGARTAALLSGVRHADAPAASTGRSVDTMALTPDRHGRGPALHVATTHRIVDVRGVSRTIRVWHELATFDCN